MERSECEVFLSNLSYSVTEEDIRKELGRCGQIVRVKLLTTPEGRSRGSGFVGFETPEAATEALSLSGTAVMGREMRVSRPGDRPARKEADSTSGNAESNAIFVGNVSYQCTEEALRAFFAPCGSINAIRLARGDDGRPKGFAHVEFEDSNQAQQAVQMTGKELAGRSVRVDFATGKRGRR